MSIELAHPLLQSAELVRRQLLLRKPSAALLAEQVRVWTARDEMRVKHRVHLVLQSRSMPNQLRATCNLSAQRFCSGIRHPHHRQEAAGVELRKDPGVDLIRLHSRVRDRTHL